MRVVVADDSVLLREGLVRLLTEVDCDVVAAVEDAPSFLHAAAEHRPDVAIVDVRMPPGMTDDGLRAAVEARESQPDLGILMLSAYVELSYADVPAVRWPWPGGVSAQGPSHLPRHSG